MYAVSQVTVFGFVAVERSRADDKQPLDILQSAPQLGDDGIWKLPNFEWGAKIRCWLNIRTINIALSKSN
jgi:hypothetical protein